MEIQDNIGELDLSKFLGIQGLLNYNNFFHPNICHVCKTTIQIRLKMCPGCLMISYCCEEHRIRHWPQHKEMCEAIRKLIEICSFWNSCGKIWDSWLHFRKENVRKIKPLIGRELEPYEEQMFMNAKSCFTCHQQIDLVAICENCFCVNSCINHGLPGFRHDCKELKTSLILDINYLPKEQHIKRLVFYVEISIPFFPSDMKSFVQMYGTENTFQTPCPFFGYYYSDWLSDALTMCQVLLEKNYEYLAYKSDLFLIHIISEDRTDMHDWLAWEVFLHLLQPGTTLKIVMIDSDVPNYEMPAYRVCTGCKVYQKKLLVECRASIYEDYVKSAPREQPDVIIGFHAQLRKLGQQTINTINRQRCPLILTTNLKSNMDDNITRLREVLGISGIPFIFVNNRFQSLRRCRDHETDLVFCRNQHLVICDSSGFLNDVNQDSSGSPLSYNYTFV